MLAEIFLRKLEFPLSQRAARAVSARARFVPVMPPVSWLVAPGRA